MTGEILAEGFVAYVAPKRKNGFGKGWVAMGQAGAASVLKHVKSADDQRVIWALIEVLDFENLIVANQAQLARDLGMDKAQVNRSIKRLLDLGFLLEGPKIGVSKSYRLNPHCGWKGSARGHVQAIDALRQQRMKDARISGVIQGGGQAAQAAEPVDTFTGDLFEGA
jgi:hypothetical protein